MKTRQKKRLLKLLEGIDDFRRHRDQIVYPLHEILFMSLFALIKGYKTFNEIHFYISANKQNKIVSTQPHIKTTNYNCFN